MIRRSLVLVVAVGILAVAPGCGDDDDSGVDAGEPRSTAPDVDGRTFVSTDVTGHELVAGSSVSLAFVDGRLVASAGCNTMSGSYELDGDVLRLPEQLMSTMMGCAPDLMAQDEWLSSFLTAGPTLSLDVGDLTLTSGDVAIVAVDESVANPARPMVGTAWTLDTIVEGDVASSVPVGVDAPTFEIGQDGMAAVFTGCNRGSASAGLDGATLSLGPLRLTKMACPGDASAVEADVVAVLDGDVTFAIDGDRLTLTKADRGLVYRAA
jgi:heat shock protein HslJ